MLILLALLNALVAQCLATQSLEEWLLCGECETLSSTQLLQYVPAPLNPEPIDAYDRFSFLGALQRLLQGPTVIDHERPYKIPDSVDLDELTDYKLGLLHFWSIGGVPRNLTTAFSYFYAGAAEGDPDAMFMLGVAYSTGFMGHKPEPAKATLYYTLAADTGSLLAQIAMGHRFQYGINTVVDLDKSHFYYELAGDALLEQAVEMHETQHWFHDRVSRRTYAFGAEMNTGLYGRHAYKKYLPPDLQTMLPLGDQSGAWSFVNTGFIDEFDNLEDALDTFAYRAEEEADITALYALARIHAAGTDTLEPRWNAAVYYASLCMSMDRISIKSTLHVSQHLAIQSLCHEFLADRYLHGNEGVEANVEKARKNYKQAQQLSTNAQSYSDSSMGISSCRSCAMGLALCDWIEGNIADEDLIPTFKTALKDSYVTSDYTLPMCLAELQIEVEGDYNGAKDTLRKTITDTMGRAPEASLWLGQLETSLHTSLQRYVQGIYGMEEVFSPLFFAQASYDRGDIESAVLGYMICSELGIRSAALNLADLLDVRHSYLGVTYKKRWPRLKAVSEWPIPSFVVARAGRAAHYFALAAAHESIDGLTKLIEYAYSYKLIPANLTRTYLDMLTLHNFGYAHWLVGTIDYTRGHYARAMEWFSRAMVSPEAWVPVKFSQFLTALHLLRGDGDGGSALQSTTFWGRLVEAYHTIIAVDGGRHNNRYRKAASSTQPVRLGLVARLTEFWGQILLPPVPLAILLVVSVSLFLFRRQLMQRFFPAGA